MNHYVVTAGPEGPGPHWIVTTTNVGPQAPGMEFMLASKSSAEFLAQLLNTRPAYKWIAEINDLDHDALYEASVRIYKLKPEWADMGIHIVDFAPVGHGLLHPKPDNID